MTTDRKKLKKDKERLARLAEKSISIKAFLARVLGIRDNNVLSGRITHADIKELMPNLTRASFQYIVDNPDLISDGEVFLVEDSVGSIVPYFNPSYIYEEVESVGEFNVEPAPRVEIPDINEIELSSTSIYDLQNLLHIYEAHNMRGAYRRIRNELRSRKESRHASRESKERALKKTRKNEGFDY